MNYKQTSNWQQDGMVQIGKVEHFQSGKDWESYEQCLQQYLYKITDVD